MASTLRRPFTVVNTLKKTTCFATVVSRNYHRVVPSRQRSSVILFTSSSITVSPKNLALHSLGPQGALRRAYTTYQNSASGNLTQRLLYGGALVGGTIIAANLIFNRETREDGGMPPYERSYLNETFLHTGLGIGIIGVAAKALHNSGWSVRLMSANPWLVIIGGLAASWGTMYGAMAVPPENYLPKYALWAGFNMTQALILSPLFFMHPTLLAKAGLYTVGMMGSIAFVGATAKTDKYLYLGGPLLAGVTIVALSGLAPLVLPATATRTLIWSENIWLYGGLAVFGGFTLYDVQKILHHARLAQRGLIQRDAVKESISLELDFINIFIRMVQLLGMQQRRK